MATDKRQFTLRIQETTFEAIKMIAEKERRSMAVMIELILDQYILDYDGMDPEERTKLFNIVFK